MTRLARANGQRYVGDEDGFVPVESAMASSTSWNDLLAVSAGGNLSGPDAATATRIPGSHLSFESPFATDEYGKLWGIGLNYADHAADLDEERPDEPASFMQPTTAATGPGGPIRLPPTDIAGRITAEAELGVVIGRTCSDIAIDEVGSVIAGYVPIIDVTAEDVLERNPRFLTRAKSFDTFLVIGPWISTLATLEEESDITVRTVVNGEIRAENRVENMLHSPRELVAFHSKQMTLHPGDVISTGTPGAHVVEPGDAVTADVTSVGTVAADVVR